MRHLGGARTIGYTGRLGLWITLAVVVSGVLAWGQDECPVGQRPPGHDFLLIGHRGAPNHACENTLESFEQALRLGANALELDVSMTRDGQLVLWHDWGHTLESGVRSTGLCGLVHPALLTPLLPPLHEVTLEEVLRDYGYKQAGHRVPVAMFAAFVERFAQDTRARFFFLDLKIPADLPHWVMMRSNCVNWLDWASTGLSRMSRVGCGLWCSTGSSPEVPMGARSGCSTRATSVCRSAHKIPELP